MNSGYALFSLSPIYLDVVLSVVFPTVFVQDHQIDKVTHLQPIIDILVGWGQIDGR